MSSSPAFVRTALPRRHISRFRQRRRRRVLHAGGGRGRYSLSMIIPRNTTITPIASTRL